jgi:ornithine cyclodeaminase
MSDLGAALREADVVSAATTARAPLVRGAGLRDAQHVDLVGAFTPEMFEADTEAVRRAAVFVDDLDAAKAEAGELIRAAQGGWLWERVRGDLRAVVTGYAGRQGGEVTLFKSVGLALEDLALARLLL